jgi:RNA polymerase sigma factor (sigma-70 family)|nr:sigma-70 family RNA polymerase sigma factor [uncultured Bacteroides sp.]
MEYISVSEAAKKWGISERRVQKLCEENRILGVERISRIWLIPRNAEKPTDKRYKPTAKVSMNEIVETYSTYIYTIAYKLTGKMEQAEDIAQETFIKAWKHLDELKDQTALKQWLRTICVNEFRMSLRKDIRQKITYVDNIEELEKDGEFLVNPTEDVIEEVQASEDVISMRNGCFLAMSRKLSVNQRIVFSLIDMFGLSIQEVADILEITPKAVKGLLYRARMNIDSFFQSHCYFLNTENPCRCKAWAEFFQNRSELQSFMQDKILDYTEKGYEFDLEVRKKLSLYYQQIPDQMPRKEWYQRVISQFKNI